MKWTVVWKPEAERKLAALWLRSRQRETISRAAYELDATLALNPEEAGESREENRRIIFAPPLAARVEIDATRRRVAVLTVWGPRVH